MNNKNCPDCGGPRGAADYSFGGRDAFYYACGTGVWKDTGIRRHRGEQCLLNQLAERDEADAAMHKRLSFEGFDEDVSFLEAVGMLLKQFGEAREKIKAVSEALQPYLLKFKIHNTLATDAIPAVIAAVEAEARRAGLEEAAKAADGYCGVRPGLIAEKIRRLAAQGQQEKCETCGGEGCVPLSDGSGYTPCKPCKGTGKQKPKPKSTGCAFCCGRVPIGSLACNRCGKVQPKGKQGGKDGAE